MAKLEVQVHRMAETLSEFYDRVVTVFGKGIKHSVRVLHRMLSRVSK